MSALAFSLILIWPVPAFSTTGLQCMALGQRWLGIDTNMISKQNVYVKVCWRGRWFAKIMKMGRELKDFFKKWG